MPDGKTHASATVLVAMAAPIAAYNYASVPMDHAIALAAGALAGLLLTPDLDVDGSTASHQTVRRAGGCLLAVAWRLYWLPYCKIIPHRSPLSHLPVLSTALRILYLCWPLLLWNHWQLAVTHQMIYAFYGLCLADGMHWLLDNTMRAG